MRALASAPLARYALCMPTTLANNIRAVRHHLGLNQAEFAEEIASQQSYVSKWEGKGIVPDAAPLERIAELAGTTISKLRSEPWKPQGEPGQVVVSVPAEDGEEPKTVDIEVIDQPWGLGAAFTDIAVQIDKMPFPKTWVEAISISPPALLTWARARGDSMGPTIEDGDLVLLDRSRRKVDEQDALWAFTVGDTASIKRLRVKGDRFQILSDNPSVPPDEEPIDFVNIVARVAFVGKRK